LSNVIGSEALGRRPILGKEAKGTNGET